MALTTRCPQCGTTFKVVADQLRIRNGLVRCGVCASVFDGREYLDEAQVAPAVPISGQSRPPSWREPAAPVAPPAPGPSSPSSPAAPHHAGAAAWPATPPSSAPSSAPDVLRMRAPTSFSAERADDARDVTDDFRSPSILADDYRAPGSAAGRARDESLMTRRAEPQVRAGTQAQGTARSEPLVQTRSEPQVRGRAEPEWDPRPAVPAASRYEPQGQVHARDPIASSDAQHVEAYAERQPAQDGGYAPAGVYGERKTSDGVREPALHEPLDEGDAVRGEPRTRYVDDYHSGRSPPSFMDDGAHEQHAQRSRLWGVGCLLLFVLLLGLLVHTYRNQVAASFPALRPVLEAACRPLACTIGYERRIERISVMSSSLRAPPGGATSAGDAQELVLTVVLRNRYNAPQPWPSLSLELKDLADRVVVRKTLGPGDYLPADVAAQPFGANVERRLTVPISVRNVQVNGYQIDKFFP